LGWKRQPDILDQVQWRDTMMGRGSQHRMSEGRLGELGLLRLGSEGSEGM